MRVISAAAVAITMAVLGSATWAQTTAPTSTPATTTATKPRQAPDKPAPRDPKWIARHEKYVELAKKGGIDVYFLGDSITDGWHGGGKAAWQKEFAPLNAENFGIGGDRTQHVLYRITEGEFPDALKPKVVVLMIGTNNVSGADPAESIAGGIKAILDTIHQKSPDTKIMLLSVFPRGADTNDVKRKGVVEVNKLLPALADGKSTVYVDIFDKFLEKDGTLSKEIMPDGLHPNAKGYQIWADAIREPLAKMLGK